MTTDARTRISDEVVDAIMRRQHAASGVPVFVDPVVLRDLLAPLTVAAAPREIQEQALSLLRELRQPSPHGYWTRQDIAKLDEAIALLHTPRPASPQGRQEDNP